jgi:hypothetical protein
MTVIVYHQGVANLLDVEAGTLGAEWPDASLDVIDAVDVSSDRSQVEGAVHQRYARGLSSYGFG